MHLDGTARHRRALASHATAITHRGCGHGGPDVWMHAHDDDADADDATRAVPAWRPGRPITSPQCVTVPLRSLRYSPLPCSSSVLAQRTAVQIDLLRLRLRMHAFTVRKRCHTYVRTYPYHRKLLQSSAGTIRERNLWSAKQETTPCGVG